MTTSNSRPSYEDNPLLFLGEIVVLEAFPLVVGWELTLKCNLRCRHCGSSAGQPRDDELTTKEAYALCDQFPDLLVQEVDFSGGEPMLRGDWKKIALYLKDLGINTNILTHRLNLTPKKVKEIINVGITCVGVSVDGLERNHDFIRGVQGAFDKTLQGIGVMNEVGLKSNVITTVSSKNVDDLPGLMEVLNSHDVKYWRLQPLIPIRRVKGSEDLRIEEKSLLKLGRFIQQNEAKALTNGLEIIHADGLQYLFEEEKSRERRPWLGCPAGWSSTAITSDGKVKGCLSMPDNLFEGDLRRMSLWDIWFDEQSFSYNRRFTLDEIGGNCEGCDMTEQCKGGCSVCSYVATGKFHNDPYCFYMIDKKNREKHYD